MSFFTILHDNLYYILHPNAIEESLREVVTNFLFIEKIIKPLYRYVAYIYLYICTVKLVCFF